MRPVPTGEVDGRPGDAVTATDPVPPVALVLLWAGVLVDGVVSYLPDPYSWTYAHMRSLWLVADAICFVALGLAGWLGRRGRLAPGAVIAWLVSGLILLFLDQFFPGFAIGHAWDANEANSIYWSLASVSVTTLAVAWFAVRRSGGVRFAFVPVVLVVELVWFLGARQVFERGFLGYRLEPAVMISGGIALMALIVFLSGKVRGADAVRAPLVGSAAWPGQQQWAAAPGAHPAGPVAPWPGQQQWAAAPGAQPVAPVAPWGYPPYAPQRTNTLAVVALVLGVVGVSLGGVICGHIALSQIRRTGEGGRGMAIAGLVLGYLWIAVVVILLLVAASVASSSSPY